MSESLPTKEKLRVLVCGGRDYSDASRVDAVLSGIEPDVIIHGGASGADRVMSDCGRYEIRATFDVVSLFAWRAVYLPRNELVATSADKDFVKGRCETHASNLKM